MIGGNTEVAIIHAVNEELQHCIDKHGEFHNHHEAWAVLYEETQEVVECLVPFNKISAANMDELWKLIRTDSMYDDGAVELVEQIYNIAMELAKETIQVLAMCEKWRTLIDKERAM